MDPDRAIILAAGSSRRMGVQKLLLPFGESTLLGTVVNHVRSSGFDTVTVVIGEQQDALARTIGHSDIHTVFNPDHPKGMLTSVQCGLRSLPDNTGNVAVYLGDQPKISPRVGKELREAFRTSPKGILVPVFGNQRGHPLLFRFSYKSAIENLDPSTGLKGLMQLYPDDVEEYTVDEPGILMDIDTTEDYQTMRS